MDRLDNIFKNAQTDVPDNGFYARVMEQIKTDNIQQIEQIDSTILLSFKPKRFTVLRSVAIATAACFAIALFVWNSETTHEKIYTFAQNTTLKLTNIDIQKIVESNLDNNKN